MSHLPQQVISSCEGYREFIQQNEIQFQAGTILLLSGEVGIGKTEFVKALVEVLLKKQNASSPTYALHHQYLGKINIQHWDLYRLENDDDLESSGFWDQFEDQDSLIVIEWPERLHVEWLPTNWKVLKFHMTKLNTEERFIKQL